jgi:hypothetical protein
MDTERRRRPHGRRVKADCFGARAFVIACCALVPLGCHRHDRAAAARDHAVADRAYPPGRWRVAQFAEVDNVVLWVSHIVVMHQQSQPEVSKLRPADWRPDELPKRSVDEAYRIASEVKTRAQAHPEDFAKLAGQYSDDVVSRDRGGSLGGVHGMQLPAPFLDALAVMRTGQVSEVVRTPLGFHILLKRAPPPAEELSGNRLVVRYVSTTGEEPIQRNRKEAFDRAKSLVERARSGAPFSTLVSEFSENRDRGRLGNMGAWWTCDPGYESVVVEELARLPLGKISEPIDTHWGFQILQRVPITRSADYAMRAVKIQYAIGDPDSERAASRVAADIAATLREKPDQFGRFIQQHCCREVERWADGHGDPDVTNVLDRLRVGEIAAAPVRLPYFYVIPQRLDPETVSESPKPVFELPTPQFGDLETAIGNGGSKVLVDAVDDLRHVLGFAAIGASDKAAIDRALDQFRREITKAETYDARVSAYRSALVLLHDGVSEATYAAVMVRLQSWGTTEMMRLNGYIE